MRHLANSAPGLALAGLVALAAPASAEILIGGAICMTGVQAPLDEPGYKGAQVAIKQILSERLGQPEANFGRLPAVPPDADRAPDATMQTWFAIGVR